MASKKKSKVKRSTRRKTKRGKGASRRTSCPVRVRATRLGNGPWIQREGKLGGPGYTSKTNKERHFLLQCSLDLYGYRSTLGSLLVLLRSRALKKATRKVIEADIAYVREAEEHSKHIRATQPPFKSRAKSKTSKARKK